MADTSSTNALRQAALKKFLSGPDNTLPAKPGYPGAEDAGDDTPAQPSLARAAAAAAGPNTPNPSATKPYEPSLLSAALMGAGDAVNANIGRPIPGQSFRMALARGIAGAGGAARGIEAMRMAKAKNDTELADRLAEIGYREGFKPTIGEAAERAKAISAATLSNKKDIMEPQNAAISDRMQRAKTAAVNSAKTDSDKKGWAWAWDKAIEEAKLAGTSDDQNAISAYADRNFANWKKQPAPLNIPQL